MRIEWSEVFVTVSLKTGKQLWLYTVSLSAMNSMLTGKGWESRSSRDFVASESEARASETAKMMNRPMTSHFEVCAVIENRNAKRLPPLLIVPPEISFAVLV